MHDRDPSEARGVLHLALRHPLLVLALLVTLQTAFTLGSREYWAFDEPRHADALRHVLEEGHWFSLHLNGAPYPDKPPLYFWLAAGAAALLGTDGPPAFFLVSALGGFLFLAATWALARATLPAEGAAGAPRDAIAMAAPVLVLLTPLTQLLLRTTRMDLLFGAGIVYAQVLLWRGLKAGGRSPQLALGLGLAGLAVLVKGPVGIALPVAALLAFAAWTGRWRRLFALDVAVGLVLAVLPIVLWMVGVGLTEGWDYLRDTLRGQVVARTVGDHKHAQGFWFYLVCLPAAWLPWTALVATVPWNRIVTPRAWKARWAARKRSSSGTTWLGATFFGGLLVLTLATTKLFIYVMPLLAPLAVASASWWARLDVRARDRVATILAGMLVLLGATVLLAPALVPFDAVRFSLLDLAPGLLLVLGGAAAFTLRRRGVALASAVLFAAWILVALLVVPRFDAVMSPRAQAQGLARYADEGYAPLVFKVYRGTYAYYARRVLPETRDVKVLLAHVRENPRAVVATSRDAYDRYHPLLGQMRVVQAQRIEGQPHVLLVQEEALGEIRR